MSNRLRLMPFLLALLLTAPAALAWGPQGHAIVADIAQSHLDPAAAAQVRQLLALEGKHRLDDISSWADQMRKDHPSTGPWHYVDIPLQDKGYKAQRDCPAGRCVVAKLPHYVHVLADRTADPRTRLNALKWVVHLVGDIHQPLHNEDHHDKGGNTVQLVYFGTPTNLHRVWDSGIIQHALGLHTNRDYTFDHAPTRAAARRLDGQIGARERAQWSPAQPLKHIGAEAVRWSDHAHTLARTVAYGDLPERRRPGWSETYQKRAWPVVRTQLQAAGVRLADVLNAALD